jgi:hypothetical protein
MADETGNAVAVIGPDGDTGKSGPSDTVKPPATLGKLEKVVETNAAKGAGLWRIAADALLEIKTRKLWKKAKNADGAAYPNFVTYAEERFGFRKTYAYDLVKAATRKPEALTEGEARADMASERVAKPLTASDAAARMDKAFATFQDRAGDLRDRAIEDAAFVAAYDVLAGKMGTLVRAFVAKYPAPIEGTATEVETHDDHVNETE